MVFVYYCKLENHTYIQGFELIILTEVYFLFLVLGDLQLPKLTHTSIVYMTLYTSILAFLQMQILSSGKFVHERLPIYLSDDYFENFYGESSSVCKYT